MSGLSDADRMRIEDLEVMAAHQAKAIEDLSDELRRAHDHIIALQRVVKHMTDRVAVLEEGGLSKPEATKPPHY